MLKVAPPVMVERPPVHEALPVVEVQQPKAAGAPPMTLDSEPRNGSFLFEVLDAVDVAGDGSGLPTPAELKQMANNLIPREGI